MPVPDPHHISITDMERYCLGRITGIELLIVSEHLLCCQSCIDREAAMDRFIQLARDGAIRGGFEVELLAEELRPKD